jgi:hypothetical protein
MDFKVLVEHLQAAAGFEGQHVFHGRIHYTVDF